MAPRKRGPVKGTPAWNKKIMGNSQDEKRINKLGDQLLGSSKVTDRIFAGGKSELYPKKEKASTTIKRVAKKAVESMSDYAAKRRNSRIAIAKKR